MTDHETHMSDSAHTSASDSAVGADRIDAYITSVERVLMHAAVPAAERVQVLDDLETQIAEMLASEPLPISDDTVAAVIARLAPPSHFAAAYSAHSQPTPTPSEFAAAQTYSPWILFASGSCAMMGLSFLLLLLFAAGNVSPPVAIMVILFLLTCAVLCPVALRQGLAQLRTAPERYYGSHLATSTALAYWTAIPLLGLLFVCVLTEGIVLIPLGLLAFAYVHYRLLRRLHQRLTAPASEDRSPRSFRDSLWRFTGLAQPASC